MSFSAVLRQIPLPIFGNANLAIQFTSKIARKAPNYAGWLVPLGVGGAWFIWPAVSDESKVFLGLLPDPEATKAAAELAEGLNKSMADEMDQDAIDNAHKRIDSTEEDIEKVCFVIHKCLHTLFWCSRFLNFPQYIMSIKCSLRVLQQFIFYLQTKASEKAPRRLF